ncbi:MAG: hypothetical protein IPN76_22850 [Saprospiraceae bacterium]|jgi:hypothetical protein|nr:hypothetical protein [Saprospiraceae bacterium]
MFGDVAPFKHLYDMLNQYEQFNLYIDGSHGMSWTGSMEPVQHWMPSLSMSEWC